MALFLLRVHLKPHLKLFMSTLPSSPGFWARLRLLTSQAEPRGLRPAKPSAGLGPGCPDQASGLQAQDFSLRYLLYGISIHSDKAQYELPSRCRVTTVAKSSGGFRHTKRRSWRIHGFGSQRDGIPIPSGPSPPNIPGGYINTLSILLSFVSQVH